MEKVSTADGSETFHNEKYNESYHSFTGAVEEALKKFCEPSGVAELAREKGVLKLLDVCFGMGYNSAMAIDVALAANPDCVIEIVGLESDIEIVKKIQDVEPKIKAFALLKGLSENKLEISEGNVKIKLIVGDAKKKVKELYQDYFNLVFFDPFSPKTQPEMWSEEFFRHVASTMRSGAKLATYSCARVVRENMVKAGLSYVDGPKVGRRGPGTLAWKE